MATDPIPDNKLTIKDVIALFIFIGGLVTSWVNLNNNLTTITIKQEETFKYFEKRLSQLETENKDLTIRMINSDETLSKRIITIEQSYNDLDRTIGKLYQDTIRKTK